MVPVARRPVAFLLGAALLASGTPLAAADGVVPPLWDAFVASVHAAPDAIDAPRQVEAFYEQRQWRAAWVVDGRLTEAARRVLQALDAAGEHGLHVGAAPRVDASATPVAALGALEIGITARLLAYAGQVSRGRLEPRSVSTSWAQQPEASDWSAALSAAADTGRVEAVLAALPPPHAQYAALRAGLARYRAIEASGGWPRVVARVPLRPGQRGPAVDTLRRRLAAEGYAAGAASPVFDPTLGTAVRAFQRAHGLAPDGVVDARTLAALAVPAAERAEQIALNMERWRWMPRALGARHVIVNVPGFELHAVDGGREELAMRVVTGAPDTPTPVFSEGMTGLVLSPSWSVPQSIVENEILPAMARRPGYLARAGLQSVDGAFRQPPGPGNALGQVKFVLPDPFHVYLHDTPARGLFARASRAFSHGCVRVGDPFALARWVLQDQPAWTPARIRAAMGSRREQLVPLTAPVPVHIVYMTAWAQPDGLVAFYPDVYGHDAEQAPGLPGGS